MSKHFKLATRLQTIGESDGLGRKRKTHCKHGHQFDGTEKWSVNWRGYKCRVCRECDRMRLQRKRENPDFKANEAAKTARWRKNQGAAYLQNVRSQRREKKEWLDSLKVKCSRCPETHIACLEFHHRDPTKKDFLLSLGVAKYSVKRLQEEADKCDIICSNCHRKLHWDEKQTRKERKKINGHLSETVEGFQSSADRAVGDV